MIKNTCPLLDKQHRNPKQKEKTYEKLAGRMSRKTDYIISLEATTEWPLTHFLALKNKELRLSDRGKVNAARRRARNAPSRGPAMQYLSPAADVTGKK